MKKINRSVFVISLLAVGCTNNRHHDLYNESASRIDVSEIGFNPLEGNVISTFINVRDTTMSTLYGNDLAAHHAKQQTAFTDGDVLSLVTWKQREDPYWFGGNIPDKVVAIEVIRFESGEPIYTVYGGAHPEPPDKGNRIKFITEIRPCEYP